jgi:hypothetical protein
MKKIIGILVLMLLIVSGIQVTGIQINNIKGNSSNIAYLDPNILDDPPSDWLKGSDQKQTENEGFGYQIWPPYQHGQEFKPTKNKLTAVALEMFKFNNPPQGEITVSIRDKINGSDLTSKTRNTKIIKSGAGWYMFDFEDIEVIPENTYYIVCSGGAGDVNNAYAWFFSQKNKYDRGIAWYTEDSGESWFEMDPPLDFCFITYFEKPSDRSINKPFFNILEDYLEIFPILKLILYRFG